jgi:hypothetical protein
MIVGAGAVAVLGLVVASASVAGALFGGTVNATYGAATYTIPKTHVAPSAKIHIASFAPGEFSQYGGTAILTGSIAAVSTTGQENVSCNLLLTGTGPSGTGTAVIGQFYQEGTGAILKSSAYPTTSVAITGTFTASAVGEGLQLSCTSTAHDAIFEFGHLVLIQSYNGTNEQVGGPVG